MYEERDLYLFKQNIKEKYDQCPKCKRYTQLLSYDAYKFFTFLVIIPIIPLGKKHVYRRCSGCYDTHEQSWKKWQRTKEKELNKSLAKYKIDTKDSEQAIKLHIAYEIYESEEITFQFAETLAKNFPNSLDVVSYLASWYMSKKKYSLSFYFAEKTLTKDRENDKARYILGNINLINNDLLKAKEYYCSILKIHKINDPIFFSTLFNLAIQLRKINQNKEAYELLKYIRIKFAEQAYNHYAFKKEVKSLEKNLDLH